MFFPTSSFSEGSEPPPVEATRDVINACTNVKTLLISSLLAAQMSTLLSPRIHPTRLIVHDEIQSISSMEHFTEFGKNLTHLEISNSMHKGFPELPVPFLTHVAVFFNLEAIDIDNLLDELTAEISRFPPSVRFFLWSIQLPTEVESIVVPLEVLDVIEAMTEPSVVLDFFPLLGSDDSSNPKPKLLMGGDANPSYTQPYEYVRPTAKDIWDVVEDMVRRRVPV
jgi:hypothetical protein